MISYRVRPIPAEIVAEVRRTLVSPQYKSLRAHISVANGYGPCRSCLQVFRQGTDRRIYFTYNAFEGVSALPDPGPVFVHLGECQPFDASEFPPELIDLPLLLEAFGEESRLLDRAAFDRVRLNDQINSLFQNPEVIFINLRNAEAGCFIARVERV